MRMMLHVVLPVGATNAAIRSGEFMPFMQKVLGDLKPEAAFFTESEGTRSGYIFFDMKDAARAARDCRALVPRFRRNRLGEAGDEPAGPGWRSRRAHGRRDKGSP